jgi:hypothetical protein
MPHVEINFLAVLVCGVVAMIIGAIWYGPLFGKKWMKEEGSTEEELRKDFNPAKTYGLAFIGNLIIAYVLARVIGYTAAASVADGLRVAFLCWIGFTGVTMMINYLFERKTIALFFINSMYHLVIFLVFAIILSAWV